jgi:hypothetical protein
MMKANLVMIATLMLLLPALGMAQVSKERDVVAVAGEYGSSSNLSLSWTAGQTAVNTTTTSGLIVTQGFQQADQSPAGVAETMFVGDIKVFPNPLQDVLNFEISSERPLRLGVDLYDATGKKVREIPSFQVPSTYKGSIDFSNLPAGEWLLRFHDGKGNGQKTFTVVKLN